MGVKDVKVVENERFYRKRVRLSVVKSLGRGLYI